MSGICGWINNTLQAEQERAVLSEMMQGLRGGDADNLPGNISGGSALAVRSGLIPVSTHSAGTLWAAVEGQIYWRSASVAKLAAEQGVAFALIEAYQLSGAECLQDMQGPFAVVVIDTVSGSGLLAIDRMGIRTMCYANTPDGLVFGSTAESIAAHPRVGREISLQATFDYLYCHVVPSPETIYKGVSKLLPAECLIFRQGVIHRRFYWHLRYHDGGRDSFDALAHRFHGLLRDATRRSISGERAVGAFLSGGTDSSTVAGLLTELSGEPAETYSIGFAVNGFDEMQYARITARHFGTRAHEYYVTPQDVVDAIPLIARAYDEPFGNASAVPTYFCAKMAHADGTRLLLAGDGGDEIFGGNARYAKQRVLEAYWSVPAAVRRAIIEPMALAIPGGYRLPPLRKLKSYVEQASIPLPDRLEAYNFLYRAPLADILEAGFLAEIDTGHPLALLREVYQRTASASPLNRMMHLDLKFTLADNDLRKVSQMCGLAGVEVRYPLLDEALVEFSGELPPSLKVKGLKLRYFFKRALRDFLPTETISKSKHGFGLPFGVWLNEHKPLADLVHESLTAFTRRGILRSSYIKQLVYQHETGHATYFGTMIWVIVMLEHWLQARRL